MFKFIHISHLKISKTIVHINVYENKQLSQDVTAQLELKAGDSKPVLSRDLNESKDQAALI